MTDSVARFIDFAKDYTDNDGIVKIMQYIHKNQFREASIFLLGCVDCKLERGMITPEEAFVFYEKLRIPQKNMLQLRTRFYENKMKAEITN